MNPRDLDTMDIYCADVYGTQPLSRAEEARLCRLARAGDIDARNALVVGNLRFVMSIASQYAGMGLTPLELISEGNDGLLEAVGRFDERRGYKFITYAVWWVRQRIAMALAERNRIRHIPWSQREDRRRVDRIEARLVQRLQRVPDPDELQDAAGLSDVRHANALRAAWPDVSLDKPCEQLHGEVSYREALPSQDPNPETQFLEQEELDRVQGMLDALNSRQRYIVRAYYGLDGMEPLTLEQIGRRLSLTRERVRQVRDNALNRLRAQAIASGAVETATEAVNAS